MKAISILLVSLICLVGCATNSPRIPEKIYTVGVTAYAEPIQQVEWLYKDPSLLTPDFPVWAGTPLLIVTAKGHARKVKAYESFVPDDRKYIADHSNEGFVTGWIHKTNIVTVSTDDWCKYHDIEYLNPYIMPNKGVQAIGAKARLQPDP